MTTIAPQLGRDAVLSEARLLWEGLHRDDLKIIFATVERPRVSIVIVSFNAPLLLAWTLSRLSVQDRFERVPFEVVIVDNASGPQTRELLRRVEGANIVLSEDNLGFGGGCNRGAGEARGDEMLFLNPDIALMPGAITALSKTLAEGGGTGIVGGRLVYPGGQVQEAGCGIRPDQQLTYPYGRGYEDALRPEISFERDVTFVSGALLLIDRALFVELGGFDRAFGAAYFEDADLCIRAWKASRRVVYQPDATAIHVENATSPDADSVERHFRRNRPLFLERHADWLARYRSVETDLVGRHVDIDRRRVLIVGGEARATGLVETLLDLDYHITLYPLTADEAEGRRPHGLSGRVERMRAEGAAGLRRLLEERSDYFQVIWVRSPGAMEMIREVVPPHQTGSAQARRPRIVLDLGHSPLIDGLVAQSIGGDGGESGPFSTALSRAARHAAMADVVVCDTAGDARALNATSGLRATCLAQARTSSAAGADFAERSGLLFVGSAHDEAGADADALRWFCETTLPPLLQRCPGISLTVRTYANAGLLGSRLPGGTRVIEAVTADDRSFESYRVLIAPRRLGAAIPHDVLDAAAHGLPAVTTPLVAAQLGWPTGSGHLVADWLTPDAFVEAVATLYTDESLWHEVRRKGWDAIRSHADPALRKARLQAICEASGSP